MIHDPSGLAVGGAEDMRDYADLLDKMEAGIRAAYVGKTGLSEEVIDELMAKETWLTGTEAKELGFVDEVTDALEMAALNGVVQACSADLEKAGLKLPIAQCGEEAAEEEVEEVAEEVAEEVPLRKWLKSLPKKPLKSPRLRWMRITIWTLVVSSLSIHATS